MGLSIGDVEKITGISKDRLRYYEEKNLILPERNEENSYRSYDIDEVLKLLGIQLYRAMDMGVKDIQDIQEVQSIEEMRHIFRKHQEQIEAQIAELNKKNEYVNHCIGDCEKIEKYLNNISVQKVKGFKLIDRLDDLMSVGVYEKFQDGSSEQNIIIRNFVRRIELTDEGIGENAVFVLEEDDSEELECIYTVVAENSEYDPMMDTYAKVRKWMSDNNVTPDKYAYIRPLLISRFDNKTGSYLEVFAPIKK